MAKFLIYWNGGNTLGEGYNLLECENFDIAMSEARDYAFDDYCSYLGLHGLRDVDEYMEDGYSEEEAEDAVNEDAESSVDFWAAEVIRENDKYWKNIKTGELYSIAELQIEDLS